MTHPSTSRLDNATVDRKIVLSGLWISTMFVFAYVDIFGFWRADVLNGALAGTVSGPGFTIGQTFLSLATLYILIPSLMVVASLLAPARLNRAANVVVSLLYAASIVVAAAGETWVYFILGSVVEAALLLTIARLAWTWPKQADRTAHPADRIQTSGEVALPATTRSSLS